MRKNFLRSTAVLLFSALLLCAGCGQTDTDGTASTPTTERETVTNAVDLLREVPDLPYIQSVTVPYKQVYSPVLIGDTLYMTVSKSDRTETDTNRLVAHDLNTGEETLLFTSTQALANMQGLQTDGEWLVWVDLELYASACNIYMMHLESGEITCVNHFSSEAPSYTAPTLMDGVIYWIEEEEVVGEEGAWFITGAVYAYDCATKEKATIAELNNIYTNNLDLAAKDGKVVWFERIGENGAYYIYDVATGKNDTIPSKQRDAMNVQYVDGYIFASETDDYMERTQKHMVCIDIRTGEYTDLKYDFMRFYVTDNYILAATGLVMWFYAREGNTLTCLDEIACSNASATNVGENDVAFIVEHNAGHSRQPFTGLDNEITLHIYRLADR